MHSTIRISRKNIEGEELTEEDFNNLMSVDFYLPGSIEEAIIYIDMMNVVMEKYTPNIHEYIETLENGYDTEIIIPSKIDDYVVDFKMLKKYNI